MDDKTKKEILENYCSNDMAKLRRLVNKILFSMNRGQQNDPDDFYSIANEELWKAINTYNPNNEVGAKFETYLSVILRNKFNTEFTSRKRIKNGGQCEIISLENNINGLENITLIDTLASAENLEENIINMQTNRVSSYLQHLSRKEREVADLLMEGYTIKEICKKLNKPKAEIENRLKSMRSYEKKKHLEMTQKRNCKRSNFGEDNTMDIQQGTMEKSKKDQYTVDKIIKKMNNKSINFEHPLQRYAGQWSNKMKSDLVSDILQGNPIPGLIFAEQVVNGCPIIFDLDGKQRCTSVKEFKEDSFKISKSVSRNIISYQHYERDENGKPVVDENNIPVTKWEEFNIANKKYSQLPEELQEAFDTYSFDIILYLSCSDEDVAYHIQRYNQGKPMSNMQKGITKLGEDYARKVKEISAMPLFSDTDFKFKEVINGTTQRVVVESVMVSNFIEDWKKSPEDIAVYLDKNATFEMFEEVEDSVDRISNIISEKSSTLFNSKNTFLWIATFQKFKKYDIEDNRFNDFLEKFVDELQFLRCNGETFNSIDGGKNTKDKNILIKKLNHLDILMQDFFEK